MYNFLSINCNGLLHNPSKVQSLSHNFHSQCIDFLFLQETHVYNLSTAKYFESKFAGKAFWSFGSNRSSGVGIIISNKISYIIDYFKFDCDGRFIILDVTVNGNKIRLINVYAPNNPCGRVTFLKSIATYLVTNRSLILGGDFNCVCNLKLDKIGGNLDREQLGASILKEWVSDFSITDTYRFLFPDSVAVSWRNSTGVGSRLDRFYISSSLTESMSSSGILPCSFSDHDYVYVKLRDLEGIDFGPGYWKCNNSIFDSAFKVVFHGFCKTNIPPLETITLEWWDTFKAKVKDFLKLISKIHQQARVSHRKDLESQYRKLCRSESLNPGLYTDQISEIERQLKDLEILEFQGHLIRSKAKDLELGEKPSSYFLCKEAKRGQKKCISTISDEFGNIFNTSPGIMGVFRNYYSKLLSAEPIDELTCNHFLADLPQLDSTDSDLLEGEITKDEILKALKDMEDNKSPGPDGLTKEFYVSTFDVLGDVLLRVVNLCFQQESLPVSSKTSYITLICKDFKNASDVKNWRPISLLNVDVKIISKLLCTRLGKVIGEIVHLDQTCAVPGRSIQDNCHLIRNVHDYVEQKNLPCAFISLDQEKAFDRVSHEFLFNTLDAFGFGPNFKKWVKILYSDISSAVIVNQHISRPFPVTRSVRQGCGLSPALYVLALEPLLHKIRQNSQIKGVQLPGSSDSAKISGFADDGLGFCTSDASIHNLLKMYTDFGKASGSKLNYSKTKGIFLGKWKSRSDHPFGISWIEQSKVVGIITGQEVSVDDQFHPLLSKFRTVLNGNKGRSMSIFGKTVLCNVLALSKLWYRGTVSPISKHYVDLFQRETFRFIWGSTSEPIKRSKLYQPILEGGLGVTHIQTKLQSLHLGHIQSLLKGSSAKWTYFAKYWISLSLRFYNASFTSLLFPHSETMPKFYQQCISALKLFQSLSSDPLVDILNFNTKQFYNCLLKSVTESNLQRLYPQINFGEVWKNLHHSFVDNLPKTVNFRLIYDSLPLGYRLFTRHMIPSPDCVLCLSAIETSDHLFIYCPCVNVLWNIVFQWLNILSEGSIQKCNEVIRFGLIPHIPNFAKKAVCVYLLSLGKYCIWLIRNLNMYEHKRLTGNDIVLRFLSLLKTRIRVDYFRLSFADFSKYWLSSNILCHINVIDNKIMFHI